MNFPGPFIRASHCATQGIDTPARRVLVLLILAVAPMGAGAKCIIPEVDVTGRVTDAQGSGVAGASVAVSWVKAGLPRGPAHGTTDADGTFHIRFQFNTFTRSSMFGDVCREKLGHVSVSARAPGLRSADALVPVQDWRASVLLHAEPAGE